MTVNPAVESFRRLAVLRPDDRVDGNLPFGTRGGLSVRHYFPLDAEYAVRVYIQRRVPGREIDVRLDGGAHQDVRRGGTEPGGLRKPRDRADEGKMEVRVPVRGERGSSASRSSRRMSGRGARACATAGRVISFAGRVGAETGMEKFEVGGPYHIQGPGDTPSRGKSSPAAAKPGERRGLRPPDPDPAGAARLSHPPPKKREAAAEFYKDARARHGFEAGIQSALERLLVNPEFLFRIQLDARPAGGDDARRLTDFEIASRLSFFLWSSIPDDELLAAAARGQLKDPSILRVQTQRLLADSRSVALVRNFAAQWLYLRNIQAAAPGPRRVPDGSTTTAAGVPARNRAVRRQPASRRLQNIVVNLLTADYTFVNERLARHYGIPNVYGGHFRRVTLPHQLQERPARSRQRADGLVVCDRTSPVVRGKWLLENILGAPPPAPGPRHTGSTRGRGKAGKALSMRERHGEAPEQPGVRRACHAQIDIR